MLWFLGESREVSPSGCPQCSHGVECWASDSRSLIQPILITHAWFALDSYACFVYSTVSSVDAQKRCLQERNLCQPLPMLQPCSNNSHMRSSVPSAPPAPCKAHWSMWGFTKTVWA